MRIVGGIFGGGWLVGFVSIARTWQWEEGLLQWASSDLSRQSLLPSQSQLRGMHWSTVWHLNSLLGQAFTKHTIEIVIG